MVCWGQGTSYQLGIGTYSNSGIPVTVSGLTHAVAIAAHGLHSCAVKADGTAACWGTGYYGELGDGNTSYSHYASTPVAVTGLAGAVDITAGTLHSCALKSDGSIACWGNNDYGQLGDGSTTTSGTPVAVSGGAVFSN